jgi:hypothetical protein
MTMRITTRDGLAALTTSRSKKRTSGPRRGGLLRRLDAYTLWAFNPQPELTTRYDRDA